MKKFVFFLMAVMVMMVSSNVFAQKSKLYTGDKSAREIKKSQQVYWDQIENLESRISKFQKENQKLMYRFQASQNQVLMDSYADQIKRNNSLINFYQSRADSLRKRCSEFTEYATGKDDQQYLDLRSRNTNDLLGAYTIIKYLESYQTAQQVVQSESEKDDGLRGIVENQWYRDVNVTITGPGNFCREFYLKSGQKSPVFILSTPGNYTATFRTGFESKSVTKPVGPNIVYHDNGNGYDFRAILPK